MLEFFLPVVIAIIVIAAPMLVSHAYYEYRKGNNYLGLPCIGICDDCLNLTDAQRSARNCPKIPVKIRRGR